MRSARPATSETIETVLPERVFHNPVARAIIEARKELTLHPDDRQRGGRDAVRPVAAAGAVRRRHRGVPGAAHGAGAPHAEPRRRDRSPRCSSCCGRRRCASRTAAPPPSQQRSAPGDAGAAGRARPQRARRRDRPPDARAAAGDRPLSPGAGRSTCSARRPAEHAADRSLAHADAAGPAAHARPRARPRAHRRARPGARTAVAIAADAREPAHGAAGADDGTARTSRCRQMQRHDAACSNSSSTAASAARSNRAASNGDQMPGRRRRSRKRCAACSAR